MAHFPNPSKDLLLYQMLILRIYRQFTGQVCWRMIGHSVNMQLQWILPIGWQWMSSCLTSVLLVPRYVAVTLLVNVSREPRRAASSNNFCRSWNNGWRVPPSAVCRFAYKLSILVATASTMSESVLGILLAHRVLVPSALLPLLHVPIASPGNLDLFLFDFAFLVFSCLEGRRVFYLVLIFSCWSLHLSN